MGYITRVTQPTSGAEKRAMDETSLPFAGFPTEVMTETLLTRNVLGRHWRECWSVSQRTKGWLFVLFAQHEEHDFVFGMPRHAEETKQDVKNETSNIWLAHKKVLDKNTACTMVSISLFLLQTPFIIFCAASCALLQTTVFVGHGPKSTAARFAHTSRGVLSGNQRPPDVKSSDKTRQRPWIERQNLSQRPSNKSRFNLIPCSPF